MNEIRVAGLPASVGLNGSGLYATVTFQTVNVDGSPLVVTLDPPVGSIEQVGVPALLGLVAAIASGAIITGA